MERRDFLRSLAAAAAPAAAGQVMTVDGPVRPADLGVTLVHEHLFSQFGADPAEPGVYNEAELLAAVVPYVTRLKTLGCAAIADATAAWFGRAPALLQKVSRQTGMRVITNTGYYGAGNDRYVPAHAQAEPPARIAARWAREWRDGIGGTGIRPGFIKLGVDAGPLSAIDRKLLEAGALAHQHTGLPIQVHLGNNAPAAREMLSLLQQHGLGAGAFTWIHANGCPDFTALRAVAAAGAYISLDGIAPETVAAHLALLQQFKAADLLPRVLLSHDGNSFHPGRAPKPYDALFLQFLPAAAAAGFTPEELRLLTVANPAAAFTVKVRKLSR